MDSTKVGFISITQAVDLDTIESNVTTNNAKVGVTSSSIGIVELKPELKATVDLGSVSGVVNIDCSLGVQFDMVMTAATSLTFSNIQQGKTITLVVTGNFTLSHPASVKGDWSDFDGALTNQIQIYCLDSISPVFSSGLINW